MFIHHLRERQSHLKPLLGAGHFKLHHLQKCGRRSTLRDVIFRHAILRKILQRKIDPAFGVIDGDVLPEVRQLQCRAGVVRKLLPLGVAIAAHVEHQMSNGIGGILAIPQHISKHGISPGRLVLAKGPQQIGEFVLRNIQFVHGRPQSDKNRVPGLSGVALFQFRFPLIE